VAENRPISPEQARLAVVAAGLDPEKPLSEQPAPRITEQQVKEWAGEAITEVLASYGKDSTSKQESDQQMAERLRDSLPKPGWISPGGDDAAYPAAGEAARAGRSGARKPA
jgi:hypothetical protein